MCQAKRVGGVAPIRMEHGRVGDKLKLELQHLFRRQQFALQQIGDAELEPFQIQRLGEEIIGLHRHGALGDLAGQRAHEDNRDLFCGRLAAQDFADREAVEVGQKDVEEDQVGLELPRLAQRLHAIVGHDEFATQAGKAVLHQLDEIALVVNNQNSWHHVASLSQKHAKPNGGMVKAL